MKRSWMVALAIVGLCMAPAAAQQSRSGDRDDDNPSSSYGSQAEDRSLGSSGRTSETQSRTSGRDDDQATYSGRSSSGQSDSWSEWWSSWWEDNDAQGDFEQLSRQGVQRFIQKHDNNDDGYLSRGELPSNMRQQFERFDRNDDGYLSASELRQQVARRQQGSQSGTIRSSQNQDYRRYSSQDDQQATRYTRDLGQPSSRPAGQDQQREQTWSEWWSSWWEGEDSTGRQQRSTSETVRMFMERHDDDEDGYLSQNELPRTMRRHLRTIDRNDDGYISRRELEQQVETASTQSGSPSSRSQLSRSQAPRSQSSGSQTRAVAVPVEVTYVWIMDANQGRLNARDLQHAYDLLMRIDEDQDGRITRDEVRECREKVVASWIDKTFERLDENEDGALSREEARDSILAHAFEEMDRNNDDSLSRAEIRRSAEQTASRESGYDSERSSRPRIDDFR